MMTSSYENVFINHTNNMTPKLMSSFIDENTNKSFLSIFDRYCIDDKPVITKKFEFDNEQKINIEFERILNEAYHLLKSNGFNVDRTNGLVELWKYTSNGKKVNVNLTIHQDDYGALPYNVETCIFYVGKSEGLDGGELLYELNTKKNKFLGIIPYYSTETKLLNVNDRMVVLMNGNLNHRPKSVTGLGSRKSIVVQLKSLDRN